MKGRKLFFLALCLLLALSSTGSVIAQSDDEPITLRLTWWGAEARHELYQKLADLYEEQHPNITLEREFYDFAGYWEILPTQVAADNMPDIVHMHLNFINEYASRGSLLNLTPYVESGQLDLSKFPQGIIDSGKVNGEIYMIVLGYSAPGAHYNVDMFEAAGIEFDKYAWTWDEFVEIALAIQPTLPEGAWASWDSGGHDQPFEIFLRQRGKDIYTDGQLGYDKEDLRDWWGMWQELREAGATPPGDITEEFDGVGHADSLLSNDRVAIMLMSGNQHKLYQAETESQLDIAVVPRLMGEDGELQQGDVIGGAFLSCAANTPNPDECIAFIDWMINDPEVAIVYNAEHGPPGNAELAELLSENLDPADQRLFAMMAEISDTALVRGEWPEWATEAGDAFLRIYAELTFGNMSVDEAVDAYFAEVEFIAS